jgi:hypothetical protein
MLQPAEELGKVESVLTASPRFAHDFSRIPAHPPETGAVQTKLTINNPGDEYEQKADRVSEQVMRMPEPQLQRACPFEGERSKCQTKQTGLEYERLQIKRVQVGDTEQIAEQPIVHTELRALGRPLDSATRGFMESRFGHDFNRVRVHTDAKAAESARAVNALAYTVGHDVVFGAGQYVPGTSEGRRLVAHELTHVVQQATASNHQRLAYFPLSSARSDVLQRKPDKPIQAEARRDQQLEELAQDPGSAHQAWKKLSLVEQIAVTERMRRRYGEPFTQQFLDEVKKGKPQIEYRYYQPGVGPKPEQLIASGYRFAGMLHTGNAGFQIEVWVHPTGRRINRDVSTHKFGAAEPEKNLKKGPAAEPAKIDPNGDREKLFGPVIAIRVNVNSSFGIGDMILYQDGTVELFLEGTGESYVFLPLQGEGGFFDVYGPDGERMNLIWKLPRSNIPDPETDAVE